MSYDINNNCVVCDQYIYDQHKINCEHYVKETYSEFLKRVEGEPKEMKDKYLVTLEIDTYDGDPRNWDWTSLVGDESKVISSEFKGRVLPTNEGESNE